jgi:hypothetical protein
MVGTDFAELDVQALDLGPDISSKEGGDLSGDSTCTGNNFPRKVPARISGTTSSMLLTEIAFSSHLSL